jgi:hypothetical protein
MLRVLRILLYYWVCGKHTLGVGKAVPHQRLPSKQENNMSSRRRRTPQQVKTYNRGQVPSSTETQRLDRKRRSALAKAEQAERRGEQFTAAMHRREADRYRGALEKANGAQEPTQEIRTATIDWDFKWVRQTGGEMHYQKCGV